jgi:hypothetical protein
LLVPGNAIAERLEGRPAVHATALVSGLALWMLIRPAAELAAVVADTACCRSPVAQSAQQRRAADLRAARRQQSLVRGRAWPRRSGWCSFDRGRKDTPDRHLPGQTRTRTSPDTPKGVSASGKASGRALRPQTVPLERFQLSGAAPPARKPADTQSCPSSIGSAPQGCPATG